MTGAWRWPAASQAVCVSLPPRWCSPRPTSCRRASWRSWRPTSRGRWRRSRPRAWTTTSTSTPTWRTVTLRTASGRAATTTWRRTTTPAPAASSVRPPKAAARPASNRPPPPPPPRASEIQALIKVKHFLVCICSVHFYFRFLLLWCKL